jgi:hypothetical protein
MKKAEKEKNYNANKISKKLNLDEELKRVEDGQNEN